MLRRPEKDEALVRPVFSDGEGSEALRDQIRKFDQQNRGAMEVALRLAPADSGQYYETLSSVPVITLGREAIRSVRPRPVTPLYHDMSLAIAERFHASLAGIVTPERTAATPRILLPR